MATQVAYTTGTTQILRGAVGELRQWSEMPADLGEALAQLRPDTVLAAPLMVQGRPAGVLTLGRDADRPGFTENDVEVAEEFARRLADAMANAETLAREHTIAETLQRAVLPDAFPDVPGLDLAAGYLPASDGVHVGGDWYDVFLLCDNRVGLVIGDVAGHSITIGVDHGPGPEHAPRLRHRPPGPRRRAAADQRRPAPAAPRGDRERGLRRSRPDHR